MCFNGEFSAVAFDPGVACAGEEFVEGCFIGEAELDGLGVGGGGILFFDDGIGIGACAVANFVSDFLGALSDSGGNVGVGVFADGNDVVEAGEGVAVGVDDDFGDTQGTDDVGVFADGGDTVEGDDVVATWQTGLPETAWAGGFRGVVRGRGAFAG